MQEVRLYLIDSVTRQGNILVVSVLFEPCASITLSCYIQPVPWNALDILPSSCLSRGRIRHLCKLLNIKTLKIEHITLHIMLDNGINLNRQAPPYGYINGRKD
ncbi:hypothetical protein Hanom_Chr01g00074041 [Helianthus anomalus]